MNIIFERAKIEDAYELIRVQNDAFLDDFKEYGECPSYNEPLNIMEDHIRNKIVFKILDGTKIIGDVQVIDKQDKSYYLRVLCVIPEYQGLGIGQKAIERVESEIRDAKKWDLITPFKSFRNHYFYEKMGYQKVGEYKHSEVLVMYKYRKTFQE